MTSKKTVLNLSVIRWEYSKSFSGCDWNLRLFWLLRIAWKSPCGCGYSFHCRPVKWGIEVRWMHKWMLWGMLGVPRLGIALWSMRRMMKKVVKRGDKRDLDVLKRFAELGGD